MVFDDNKRICDSLKMLFTSHSEFEWQGAYENATVALEMVESYSPDVILMDIGLPQINGIEATSAIKKKFPDKVIMMLTIFDDDDKVFDAVCAGASGYIVKSRSLTHLVKAVKVAHAGGAPMTPAIARKVLHLIQQKNAPADAKAFDLTDREKEVLKHLVDGSSYKMIAVKMTIAYDTVHSHIKHIYKKLQVNSVSEAVSKALRNRL